MQEKSHFHVIQWKIFHVAELASNRTLARAGCAHQQPLQHVSASSNDNSPTCPWQHAGQESQPWQLSGAGDWHEGVYSKQEQGLAGWLLHRNAPYSHSFFFFNVAPSAITPTKSSEAPPPCVNHLSDTNTNLTNVGSTSGEWVRFAAEKHHYCFHCLKEKKVVVWGRWFS